MIQKRARILFLTLLALLTMSSCEKVIQLDLNDTTSRLVVEGWVYDGNGPFTVSLSQTTSYFKPEASPRVTGAVVVITDNGGQADTLTEVQPGIYETGHLQGIAGRRYRLQVDWKGETFTAESDLPSVVPIDSLGFIPSETFPLSGEEGKYLVTFFAVEPQPERNWYRFNLYKYLASESRDSLVNDRSGMWIITDDTALKGEVADLPFMFAFEAGDSIIVEMLSLDQPAYNYLLGLQTQLSGDGGMFSPPPANPESNITGGGIGYFGASSRVKRGIRINP